MRSEGFWKLLCWPGEEIPLTKSNSIKSFKALVETVMCAEMDEELFTCMSDPVSNQMLKDELLRLYFPGVINLIIQSDELQQRTDALLQLDRTRYKEQLEKIVRGKSDEEIQEEYFVRGALFKKEVPKQYDYTCAISRMRIISFENIQMVDACHIVPFSVSQDDTIKNGICLSPTLHRAFDRGLITITEDYKVKVSPAVREVTSTASLGQFNGIPILTPPHPAYVPSKENLLWHGREVFVGA
jgi:putative restriction endonuclease